MSRGKGTPLVTRGRGFVVPRCGQPRTETYSSLPGAPRWGRKTMSDVECPSCGEEADSGEIERVGPYDPNAYADGLDAVARGQRAFDATITTLTHLSTAEVVEMPCGCEVLVVN